MALAAAAITLLLWLWLSERGTAVLQPEMRPGMPPCVRVTLDTRELLSALDIAVRDRTYAWRGEPSWQVVTGIDEARWINARRHWDEFEHAEVTRGDEVITGVAEAEPFRVEVAWRPEGRRVIADVSLTVTEPATVGPLFLMRLFLSDVPRRATFPARVTGGSPENGGLHWEIRTEAMPRDEGDRYPRPLHFTGWIAVRPDASSAELVVTTESASEPVDSYLEWDESRGCPTILWRCERLGLWGNPAPLAEGDRFHLRVALGTERPADPLPDVLLAERAGAAVALGRGGPLSAWRLDEGLRPYPGLDLPPAHEERPTPIELTAARGGGDLALLHVRSDGRSVSAEVKFGALASGEVALRLERTRCLLLNAVTDPGGALGRTPEVLLPVEPGEAVAIPPEGQGFLLTAIAGRGATPGVVSGEIVFGVLGQAPLRVPVSLEVIDWSPPVRPTLRSAFELYTWNLSSAALPTEGLHEWADLFGENHLGLAALRPPQITPGGDDQIAADWTAFDEDIAHLVDRWGTTTFLVPFGLAGSQGQRIEEWGQEAGQPLWRAYLRQLRAHLAERGWLDEALLMLWDEPNATEDRVDVYQECVALAAVVSEEAPGLAMYISTTEVLPELERDLPPGVQGGLNLPALALHGATWPEDALRRRWLTLDGLERGWVSGSLMAVRRIPRIAWAFGLEGIELWSVNAWNDPRRHAPELLDPVDPTGTAPLGPVPAADLGGTLLYRTPAGHPLRSLTWVALGQGMEDVEILRALEQTDPEAAASWRTALQTLTASRGAPGAVTVRWDREARREALRRLGAGSLGPVTP